jgi:hypothetical protein
MVNIILKILVVALLSTVNSGFIKAQYLYEKKIDKVINCIDTLLEISHINNGQIENKIIAVVIFQINNSCLEIAIDEVLDSTTFNKEYIAYKKYFYHNNNLVVVYTEDEKLIPVLSNKIKLKSINDKVISKIRNTLILDNILGSVAYHLYYKKCQNEVETFKIQKEQLCNR